MRKGHGRSALVRSSGLETLIAVSLLSCGLPGMESLVTGKVVFDEGSRAFSDAIVYARLLDVSRVDAASDIVAESVLHAVSLDMRRETSFTFSIPGQLPEPSARYEVTVHIDVDKDGKLSKGDYFTTQSYPVLTHGYPDHVIVRVTPI